MMLFGASPCYLGTECGKATTYGGVFFASHGYTSLNINALRDQPSDYLIKFTLPFRLVIRDFLLTFCRGGYPRYFELVTPLFPCILQL